VASESKIAQLRILFIFMSTVANNDVAAAAYPLRIRCLDFWREFLAVLAEEFV